MISLIGSKDHGNAHTMSIATSFEALNTKIDGLTTEEATKRLQEYGYNELEEAPKKNILSKFLYQFTSIMIFVLIAAAIIAALLGKWVDASAIATILILNAILGTVQEYRAEKAIDALRKMVVQVVRVVRDGKEQKIMAQEIVPGDIIVIEAGDRIPADSRLIEAYLLRTNEASLTGESLPVEKEVENILLENTSLSDRTNMIFTGTTVSNGRGRAIVTATGMNSEFGKIAQTIQETDMEETPLKEDIEKFGKQLAIIVVIGAGALFVFGVMKGIPYVQMLLTSISLAVAVIPEGLPAVITIALAFGGKRMAAQNAIVRRLLAVETLGSTNVILTDKTGTLTKNEMTVRQIFTSDRFYEVTGAGYENNGNFLENGIKIEPQKQRELDFLLYNSALCNNSDLIYDEKKKVWSTIGDPTEAALLVLAHKAGVRRSGLKKTMRFVGEIPFDPVRKKMTVIYEKSGETIAFTKGAPEYVLQCCSHIAIDDKEVLFTDKERAKVMEAQRSMSENALRVIAFARRIIIDPEISNNVEQDMTFIGLAGIIDPPRKEVKEAVELCRSAGIEVAMITGDNELTARAVAREVGLLREGDLIVTGQELNKMSENQLGEKVESIRVYARVEPDQKLRIVSAWKAKGKIVAVTGDGVNDGPALKHADIGIAMGITGTDVAKEVSQMTLADDNFATIVKAVEEGRGIYENIRKCVFFIFPANIAEVLVVFFVILMGFPLPMTAIQILWVNLVMETIPAFSLAIDPIDREVMTRQPRFRNESLWKGGRVFLVDYSIILAAAALGIFLLMQNDIVKAQTMVFTTIVISGVFRAFNCRSLVNPVNGKIFENRWLVLTVIFMFLLQVAVVSFPYFSEVLSVKSLDLIEWLMVIGVCAAGFVYIEIYKTLTWQKRKRGNEKVEMVNCEQQV
ncbi:MAG: cation-translocating P-type ATPase [Candidatus Methanoperedens sp.]|nr:cation-translocating P-type ATPase [Candidatus Methanoperedens sp.]